VAPPAGSVPASDAAARSQAAGRAYQAQQSQFAVSAAVGAVLAWRQIDGKALDASWPRVASAMTAAISAAQREAAEAAPAYLARVAAAQDAGTAEFSLDASAFAGLTGDGRSLAGMLYAPVALSKQYIGAGQPIADVLKQEELHVAMLAQTVTLDAGRMASQGMLMGYPVLRGYVRVVHMPACARCIILAGRFYRRSDGFYRHPNCKCTMLPARGEEWVPSQDPQALMDQMQADHPEYLAKSLTKGDLQALEHGANLNQVVNAHRGMATANAYGRKISVTTEGTTKRGFAGRRMIREAGAKRGAGRYSTARAPRLTPAQIFAEADSNSWDRDEIVRQLKRFGYVV
jgi:hypothetical protein